MSMPMPYWILSPSYRGKVEGIGSNEYSRGAGLYISFANPTIRHCIFNRDHVGTYGGGIFIKGWSSFKDPPLIENCEFANNFSSHYGPGTHPVE